MSAVFSRNWCIAFLLFALAVAGAETELFEYRSETRTEPRPLSIHVLQIDLEKVGDRLCVAVGKDPDGDGPADAELEDPRRLAADAGFRAAVNANAWSNLSTQEGEDPPRAYLRGGHVNIRGLVVRDGETISRPQQVSWSFWLDANGRGQIGPGNEAKPHRLAVSGFGGLLRNGEILPRDREDAALHPRSALGIDASGKLLTLVVVDGRQRGRSEGMSAYELAVLMKELACTDALNLDGGGSSVMIIDNRIVNTPAGFGTRPVPVMIGIR